MSSAAELVAAWGGELTPDGATSAERIERAFDGVPLDFPVHISPTLPLMAHRAGAAGITLFGRVHLIGSVLEWSPTDRLLILRHEAEHVRQQRSQSLFYPRYIGAWLGRMAREIMAPTGAPRNCSESRSPGGSESGSGGRSGSRSGSRWGWRRRLAEAWRRAYLAIPAEVEAYAAERRARGILAGRS